MTTRDALWANILADLKDDTPRLVYADLLDEEGDSVDRDRAALIRCQYALAGCGPPHKEITNGGRTQPVVMTPEGDSYYTVTGEQQAHAKYVVGDRVDVLAHRALKKPVWVYGLKVVKFMDTGDPFTDSAVLKRDEHSGPWKGTALKKEEEELLRKHPAWSSATCPQCEGAGEIQVGRPPSPSWTACPTCNGSGDLLHRDAGARYTTHGITTVLHSPRTLRWRSGFIERVDFANLEEVYRDDAPTPLAVELVKAIPTLTKLWVPLEPNNFGTAEEPSFIFFHQTPPENPPTPNTLPATLWTSIHGKRAGAYTAFPSAEACKEELARLLCRLAREAGKESVADGNG